MAIIYPQNRQEIVDRIGTDVQAQLPESEPFLRNSYLNALIIGFAGGLYDVNKTIASLQRDVMPDTSTGDFADRWASIKKIYRNPATQSSGYITVTGVVDTLIPLYTELNTSSGIKFLTQNYTAVQPYTMDITSMVRSGGVVSVTTVDDHNFASGNSIIISGADQTEYNGTFVIVVTGTNTFTYDITTTPTTPATGTIKASQNYTSILVKSTSYGSNTNLSSGSELFFSSLIPGIDESAFVQYEGLTGGENAESDTNFRSRYLYALRNPVSFFNVAAITTKCQEVNGVTRVFVQQITPAVGQITVFFMRDNDVSPIPSGAQVAIVKDKWLEIRPAHVDPDDMIVKAPTPKVINFKFSVLDPDTDTMRAAITANLQAFFAEIPIVGNNLSKNSYASAIYYTVDTTTGQFVNNFVLAEPIGDILVGSEEIAILGTVNF